MRHVEFNPARLQGDQQDWWARWELRATEARTAACQDFHAGILSIDRYQQVWKDLKTWLLEHVFHEKCAYCESPLARQSGHAEHYRPKKKVTNCSVQGGTGRAARKRVVVTMLDENGGEIAHPGYFWLAFDWRNIVPSCEFCNTAGGKGTDFPIERGYVHGFVRRARREGGGDGETTSEDSLEVEWIYPESDMLDLEEHPLLLHPYRHDPSQHLGFGERGTVYSRTPLGLVTIQVYNLRNERLRKERQRAQADAWRQIAAARVTGNSLAQRRRAQARCLTPYENGSAPYSAACLDYLHKCDDVLHLHGDENPGIAEGGSARSAALGGGSWGNWA